MKKVVRGTNGFNRLSNGNLLIRSKEIRDCIAGNPQKFTDPTPTVGTLTSSIDAFEEAVVKAQNGTPQDKKVRTLRRSELIDVLHLMSNYVTFIAAGDPLVITLGGFVDVKPATPAPPLEAVKNLVLKNSNVSGELVFTFDRVEAAKGYLYEITPAPLTPESVWTPTGDTVCKITFSSLERGIEYFARVTAIGINGQMVTSGTVNEICL